MAKFIECRGGWINAEQVVRATKEKGSFIRLDLVNGDWENVCDQHFHEGLADLVPVTGYVLLHPHTTTRVIDVIPIIGMYIARTEESSRALVATVYADSSVHTFDGDWYFLQLPDGRVRFYGETVTYDEWYRLAVDHRGYPEEEGVE